MRGRGVGWRYMEKLNYRIIKCYLNSSISRRPIKKKAGNQNSGGERDKREREKMKSITSFLALMLMCVSRLFLRNKAFLQRMFLSDCCPCPHISH